MISLPVVYVSDMERAIRFYACLGLSERVRSRSNGWVELAAGDGHIALHVSAEPPRPAQPTDPDEPVPAGRVTLSFISRQPLEDLVRCLAKEGYRPWRDIVDEAFGRSLVVADPDGLLIQVNEHDEELYT
ncbi:VOC family protein [Actinomycetes bacterium KLBMP 9797]